MTQGYVLEVRTGAGDPASIALLPGTPLDPTSFGAAAMWRIVAQGVLDVHGYVFFDGSSVFIQSADDQFPVFVNRHRVGTAWTEIRAPSVIVIGNAQVELRVSDALARSGALVAMRPQFHMTPAPGGAALPPQPPKGPWDASTIAPADAFANLDAGAGTGPRPFAGDDISTRFAPLGIGSFTDSAPSGVPIVAPVSHQPVSHQPASPRPISHPPPISHERLVAEPQLSQTGGRFPRDGLSGPRIGAAALGSAPRMSPGPTTSPSFPAPVPLAPTNARIVVPRGSLWERAKADWNATSLPKRVLFVLSPFVVLSYFKLFFSEHDPEAETNDVTATGSTLAPAEPVESTVRLPPATVVPTLPATAIAPTPPQPFVPPTQVVPPPTQPTAIDPRLLLPPQGTLPTATAPVMQQVPPTAVPTFAPTVVPTFAPTAVAPTAPTTVNTAPIAPTAVPTAKTLERAAADAYAEGNLQLALLLYERLAREHPENPAFADAARMIRERLMTGR
jgi:hypothetical protein